MCNYKKLEFHENYYITNKFVSSNSGNNFKIDGADLWRLEHFNAGYYKFVTKQMGVDKCLTYSRDFKTLKLIECRKTALQLYTVQERIGDVSDPVKRGYYEILTKKGYYQIGINKNAHLDGKQIILKEATTKGDDSQYWSFAEKPFMEKGLRFVKKVVQDQGRQKSMFSILPHITRTF